VLPLRLIEVPLLLAVVAADGVRDDVLDRGALLAEGEAEPEEDNVEIGEGDEEEEGGDEEEKVVVVEVVGDAGEPGVERSALVPVVVGGRELDVRTITAR